MASPERLRARRLEREFARLRPLGEAYLMRRFDGQISRADAEDAVAEVLARLYRRIGEGHVPHNLQATFLTAARNAAIDLLRSRKVSPSAPLEAAADAATEEALPAERAESRESAVRLQEAAEELEIRLTGLVCLRGRTVRALNECLNEWTGTLGRSLGCSSLFTHQE